MSSISCSVASHDVASNVHAFSQVHCLIVQREALCFEGAASSNGCKWLQLEIGGSKRSITLRFLRIIFVTSGSWHQLHLGSAMCRLSLATAKLQMRLIGCFALDVASSARISIEHFPRDLQSHLRQGYDPDMRRAPMKDPGNSISANTIAGPRYCDALWRLRHAASALRQLRLGEGSLGRGHRRRC